MQAFLLDNGAPASAETLRRAGLGPYAYCVLPRDDARRMGLRGDYLGSLRRHQEIRSKLMALLRAWHEVGIEALPFKGFQLSEMVYPHPGMRFHGDVDVLIRPGDAERAVSAAREAGWDRAGSSPPSRHGHAICSLGGDGGTLVDLHRYALHRWMPWSRAAPRITRAVWERSERMVWEGVPIRVPAPVDALLVGLVLQRLWSERGYLKPHDPLDFRLLAERVSGDELAARARALGCTRTLAHFLERCDPERGRLRLVPSRADRRALGLAVRVERGLFSGRVRLHRAPGLLVDILRVLPDVLTARRALRRTTDLRRLFERFPATRTARSSPERRRHTVRGIRWATRLLRLNLRGDCVLRSVALYAALVRQGWPVSFVSGVLREGGRVEGHAWIEYDGRVLPELGEPAVRPRFRETFRWPLASKGETEP